MRVVFPILPAAQVLIAKFILEEPNDSVLRLALDLPDLAHAGTSRATRRVRPVNSSCIIPVLIFRTLVRRARSLSIPQSTSLRVHAMARCSSGSNGSFNGMDRNCPPFRGGRAVVATNEAMGKVVSR